MVNYDNIKADGLGIRSLFRIAIIVYVLVAYLILSAISFSNVSADARARSEASMKSEANYLCLQLESLGNRADTFKKIASSLGADPKKLEAEDPEGYNLLSNPIGDVLSGYTLAETGTVALIVDDEVIASDDTRVPVGSKAQELLGDEVYSAIAASIQDGKMQPVPYRGVFDEPDGAAPYGAEDDAAYLMAGQQGEVVIMIIEPESMVYKNRNSVMGRETTVSLVILIVVSILVDRLLSLAVARRIDETNDALARITSGDLETRVPKKGTREFVSLATGINVTVEALQGWIAEAETRMASELTAARAIQESALPRTFPPYPDIHRFDVYAIMDAAKEVGGDFFDIFLVDDSGPETGKLAFLVADVSGKGVPAALFMMKAKAQIRRELQSGLEPSQAIENANAELADGNDACMFVTMWVGVLDYETGHVDYVNAGHNPPLLWRENNGWTWLREKSGLPLGLIAGGKYKTYSVDCCPGDEFLLYTDGVSEAMSAADEMYGEDRIEQVANMLYSDDPEELVKAIRCDVATFAQGAEQSDDITVLVLEVGDSSERPASSDSQEE